MFDTVTAILGFQSACIFLAHAIDGYRSGHNGRASAAVFSIVLICRRRRLAFLPSGGRWVRPDVATGEFAGSI
jgi:hypothetical protein